MCHLFLFRDHLAKIRTTGYIYWEDISQEMFQEFQSITLPFILRSGAIKYGGDENEDNVNNKQLKILSMLSKSVLTNTPNLTAKCIIGFHSRENLLVW